MYPGAPTNIYIQGLDTVSQLSNEIRVLKEENLCLQSRLQASSGASCKTLVRFCVSKLCIDTILCTHRQMRGDDAAARGRVYGSCQAETGGDGGRAVEGGAEAAPDSQSGAGTADTHSETGTTEQPGENQQVCVCVFAFTLFRMDPS